MRKFDPFISQNFFKNFLNFCKYYYSQFSIPNRITQETTIFAEFTNLAIKHLAVNLGQGFPDFETPQFVIDNGILAMQQNLPKNHQYIRSQGKIELCEELSILYQKDFKHLKIDPLTNIQVCNGATQVMFTAIMALLHPGEKAICIDPFYDAYEAQIKFAGGKFKSIPLRQPKSKQISSSQDFQLDYNELCEACKDAKLLIINNPHNPTGKVYIEQELFEIGQAIKKSGNNKIIILSDEVYEYLLFDNIKHYRIANVDVLKDRVVTISSAGKTFCCTGWKVGWAIGPQYLIKPIELANQFIPYCVANPLQTALAYSFKDVRLNSPNYFDQASQLLQKKRNRLMEILKQVEMSTITPKSGYFMLADISKLNFPLIEGKGKDYSFCKWLTESFGVTPIPTTYFYSKENKYLGENYVRFCFAKKDEVIEEAKTRLQNLKQQLKK